MSQLINVFPRILPILIMLLIGFFFKRKQIFSSDAIVNIKNVVIYITLPVLLFGAFYNVTYNYKLFIIFSTVFLCSAIAMFVAFLVKKILNFKLSTFPFLLTGFEAGMLGYAFYSTAFGTNNISKFASVDLGQTVFVYLVVMTTLYYQNSKGQGIDLLLKSIAKTPPFWGVLAGIIFGISGIGHLINLSIIGPTILSSINFISAPTGALILLIVGYELDFSIKNISAATITILTRLIIMVPLLFIAWAVISSITGSTDILLKAALTILFILPAPFVIPIFIDDDNEKEYISTTLSINTLVTIILFIGVITFIK